MKLKVKFKHKTGIVIMHNLSIKDFRISAVYVNSNVHYEL